MIRAPLRSFIHIEAQMFRYHWLLIAAALSLPQAAALAQAISDPADPQAPAPALRYQSVFDNGHAHAEDERTPDEIWRAANERLITANADTADAQMPGMTTANAAPASQQQQGHHHAH
jgi:hypothetical protein